jgi:hypothetical protein
MVKMWLEANKQVEKPIPGYLSPDTASCLETGIPQEAERDIIAGPVAYGESASSV